MQKSRTLKKRPPRKAAIRSAKQHDYTNSAILLFALIVRRLPSSRLWEKIVLRDQSTSKRGYVSSESRVNLVGKQGKVLTELRPSGSVLVEGRPVDVVSEGAFIGKDEVVEIVAVHGSRVVVRKVAV